MPVNTITAEFSVSGPLDQNAINYLAATGATLLINVRPDNECAGQTNDTALAAMAEKAGLAYAFIPVTSGDYPDDKIAAFATALAACDGAVHGLCRTGTRAAHLWALAKCKAGVNKVWLQQQLVQAGIDVAPLLANCEPLDDKKAAA